MPQLLDTIKSLEGGCKKFDSPESSWVSRRDFSNFSFTDKHTIVKIIDRILDLLKERDAIFSSNISDQKTLIGSLDSLMSSGEDRGIFRKFLGVGKERVARDTAKRLLNQSYIPEDIDSIKDLNRRAKSGMQICDAINELLSFLNEDGISRLSKELVEGKHDSFSSKLISIRESLNDFDELQAHDKRKAELTPKENETLRICIAELLTETDWSDILKQEFYSHWIDLIEQKYPDLKGQPFETYLHNRDRLSNLLKEHRNVVVQKIINQINSSIISILIKANGLENLLENERERTFIVISIVLHRETILLIILFGHKSLRINKTMRYPHTKLFLFYSLNEKTYCSEVLQIQQGQIFKPSSKTYKVM